ncbi:hypothetical protein ACHIPZ_10410 [Antrihabitans sp. NCIMB 15449]|uniref:Uncharacterized protein n=1 Tax=Antrihabitans spumae TaxID=3373370 RepID=A0ABW7JLB9_9NOCA
MKPATRLLEHTPVHQRVLPHTVLHQVCGDRGTLKMTDRPVIEADDLEYDPRSLGKVIRDPIHDYINVPAEIMLIVNHPFFQRLRRVGQTSMSSSVYPSMNGRRFEHSLGAMHLAIRGWDSAWNNCSPAVQELFRETVLKDLRRADTDQATAALVTQAGTDIDGFKQLIATGVAASAILHDIGHPPFSHTLEDFYRGRLDWILRDCHYRIRDSVIAQFAEASSTGFHEVVGAILRKRLQEELGNIGLPWLLIELIASDNPSPGSWNASLHDLISGEVDIDRMDYLMRDRHNSGTEFGVFDRERLIQSLELHYTPELTLHAGPPNYQWAIGYGMRAVSALESLIHGRFNYYRWVVYHHHTVAANRFLNICLINLIAADSTFDESGKEVLPQNSPRLNYFASSDDFSASASLNLAMPDDMTILEWIKNRSEVHRNASISTQGAHDAREQAREKFVALSDIVLFRAQNWCSLWDSEWSYRAVCEAIEPRLMRAVNQARSNFERWASAKDSTWGQAINSRRRIFEQIENTIRNPLFTATGPVPLMNMVAEKLFGTSTSAGEVRLQREISEADSYATVAGPVEGHSRGFWVFAHNTMKPWQDDEFEKWGSQVFVKNKRHALIAVSGPAMRELPNREAERVQFHCYFVDPALNGTFNSASLKRISETFLDHYPAYVFNALNRFVH